ncbi:MAG: hypothetical protein R3310_15730 [Candidatus Competibacteraceae bacterium]|nr:hypothetical protein [Candidatus Competibacteraceae bacterium]
MNSDKNRPKGPQDPGWVEEVRHETGEAAHEIDSVAGEEDPGSAAEYIAEDIDRAKPGSNH